MTGHSGSRKRRRPAKSCESCRRRKIRCDQEVPCGPCRRARGSVECSFKSQSLNSNENSRPRSLRPAEVAGLAPQSGEDYPQPTAERSIAETSSDQHARPPVIPRPAEGSTRDAPPPPPYIFGRGTISDEYPDGASRPPRPGPPRRTQDQVDQQQRPTGPTYTSDRRFTIKQPIPRLRNTREKTKLFGNTHWMHMVEYLVRDVPACPSLCNKEFTC